MEKIDIKIIGLRKLTTEFIFIEYDVHENCDSYKIYNEFTSNKNKDKIILCRLDEGIETAIDLAYKTITKWRNNFFGEKNK